MQSVQIHMIHLHIYVTFYINTLIILFAEAVRIKSRCFKRIIQTAFGIKM